MIKVSVITVVFNRAHVIERCVQSVLNQSYKNIEYIIIDGESSDGTLENIYQYKDRISKIISEKDRGIYDAMNKGISLATGEYVILLNSDDWYATTAIEELVNKAVSSKADIVHADAFTVDSNNNVTGSINGWLHSGLYTKGMPLRHETMLVKRQVYDSFGLYDVNYSMIADYVFVCRVFSAGVRFAHLRKPLLYFRMDGYSNVNNEVRVRERQKLFSSLFPFLDCSDLQTLSVGASKVERGRILIKYLLRDFRFSWSMLRNLISLR